MLEYDIAARLRRGEDGAEPRVTSTSEVKREECWRVIARIICCVLWD